MVCKRSGIPNPGFLLTSHRLHCSSSPATESLFTFKTNVTKNFFSSHLWILLHNSHFHSQTEKFCTFQSVVLDIILHSTHSLFSDWPKAYNEFSKSAPGTSSSRRLYNNHVKVLGNHVMYDCRAWFSNGSHVKFVHSVLLAVSHKNMTSTFALVTEQDIEKVVEFHF